MRVDDAKTLQELIRKLDMIEEEQVLNEKRIRSVRLELLAMLPLASKQ